MSAVQDLPDTKIIHCYHPYATYTYRGECRDTEIKDGDTWRPATKEERRAIRVQELAEMWIEREILCCDSCLVSDLMQQSYEVNNNVSKNFAIEEATNIYLDTSSWSAERCKEYLDDYGHDYPDDANPYAMDADELRELFEEEDEDFPFSEDHTLSKKELERVRDKVFSWLEEGDWEDVDIWREAAHELALENPQEPYEWWRISNWLARRLEELDEVILDNDYGVWWGRCGTGQAINLDGTFQRIAERFLNEYPE